MVYHYRVTCSLACGCQHQAALELPEGEEPNGMTVLSTLVDFLTDDITMGMIFFDIHEEKGNEKVTVTLETKVGEARLDEESA